MPTLTKEQLLEKVIQAAALSGWSVGYVDVPPQHPFRVLFSRDDKTEDVLLYIWNITHGGKHRPADEYRIQITSVSSFNRLPGVKTLVLGYWAANDVFAGWDASKHTGQLGSSPSLQIREYYLLNANVDGLAACPKGNDEVAIAFAPSSLINYVSNLYELHGAASPQEQAVLTQVAQTDGHIDESAIVFLPPERQKVIATVAAYQRASRFRRRVITAYNGTCAVCGMQLELVDAAHIIPVKHPASTDGTRNGLCLRAMHHRAFVNGLIAVLPNYGVAINQKSLNRLRTIGQNGEELRCLGNLRAQIILPAESSQRPVPSLLSSALEIRNLSQSDLKPTTMLFS